MQAVPEWQVCDAVDAEAGEGGRGADSEVVPRHAVVELVRTILRSGGTIVSSRPLLDRVLVTWTTT